MQPKVGKNKHPMFLQERPKETANENAKQDAAVKNVPPKKKSKDDFKFKKVLGEGSYSLVSFDFVYQLLQDWFYVC